MRAGITEAHGTALVFFVTIFLLFLVEIGGLSQLPTCDAGDS